MTEFYQCPFNITGVKIPVWTDLPSPPKGGGIQITVCASTWNRTFETIVKSIESIFNQEFPPVNYEVILADDATEGERAVDVKNACDYLINHYPDRNFRAYFISHTRCWTDPHTLNVAFKRAMGQILMISQVDIIHSQNTLEASWRHHNNLPNLWLCPKHYAPDYNHPWPFCYFPHEMGSSVKREWVHKIKGRNENIIKEPADVEFHTHLNRIGVRFGEDPQIQTFHIAPHPNPRTGVPRSPQLGIDYRNTDGTWTIGDWGVLTHEEEAKTILSEPMKKCILQL